MPPPTIAIKGGVRGSDGCRGWAGGRARRWCTKRRELAGSEAGKARIEQFASWVGTQLQDAAGSLGEGSHDSSHVSATGLAPSLKRYPGTTNVIDNALGDAQPNWPRDPRSRNGSMAVRWTAAAFLEAGKGYRRMMGYRDLWMLKAHLDELSTPPG